MTSLTLRPLDNLLWAQYQRYHLLADGQLRGTAPLRIPPPCGVWVCRWVEDSGDPLLPPYWRLAAGAGIFNSDGPFFVVDGLVTDPALSFVQRHHAVRMVAQAVWQKSQLENKHVLAFATTKGLTRLLRVLGYVPQTGILLHREPG